MIPELAEAYHEVKRLQARMAELEAVLARLLSVPQDHMTACDKTMGGNHACTCGAMDARALMAKPGFRD